MEKTEKENLTQDWLAHED